MSQTSQPEVSRSYCILEFSVKQFLGAFLKVLSFQGLLVIFLIPWSLVTAWSSYSDHQNHGCLTWQDAMQKIVGEKKNPSFSTSQAQLVNDPTYHRLLSTLSVFQLVWQTRGSQSRLKGYIHPQPDKSNTSSEFLAHWVSKCTSKDHGKKFFLLHLLLKEPNGKQKLPTLRITMLSICWECSNIVFEIFMVKIDKAQQRDDTSKWW